MNPVLPMTPLLVLALSPAAAPPGSAAEVVVGRVTVECDDGRGFEPLSAGAVSLDDVDDAPRTARTVSSSPADHAGAHASRRVDVPLQVAGLAVGGLVAAAVALIAFRVLRRRGGPTLARAALPPPG